MNLKHLGDALDYWKGSVIEFLGEKNLQVVRNLQVVPMFTDQELWAQQNFDTYAKLLRRDAGDILKKDKPFSNSKSVRDSYFESLGERDLFLDPDTGIASEKGATAKHVKPSEIASLLEDSGSRVLLIYQHSARRKNGFSEKLKSLRRSDDLKSCYMFAYDAGAVSMVVISRGQERISEALRRIQSWLDPVASARIIQ